MGRSWFVVVVASATLLKHTVLDCFHVFFPCALENSSLYAAVSACAILSGRIFAMLFDTLSSPEEFFAFNVPITFLRSFGEKERSDCLHVCSISSGSRDVPVSVH